MNIYYQKEVANLAHSQFTRTEMLLGADSTGKLKSKKVILFGLGGVGSYTAEIGRAHV